MPAYEAPILPDPPLTDTETVLALTITTLSFAEGNKWRLSDGRSTFYATIEDDGFLSRVNRNDESFSKGDILRCQVRVRQWQTSPGLRTDYSVIKVLEHIPAARNLPLPFVDADHEDLPKLPPHDPGSLGNT